MSYNMKKNDCPIVIKDIFYDVKHSIGRSISRSDWILLYMPIKSADENDSTSAQGTLFE